MDHVKKGLLCKQFHSAVAAMPHMVIQPVLLDEFRHRDDKRYKKAILQSPFVCHHRTNVLWWMVPSSIKAFLPTLSNAVCISHNSIDTHNKNEFTHRCQCVHRLPCWQFCDCCCDKHELWLYKIGCATLTRFNTKKEHTERNLQSTPLQQSSSETPLICQSWAL